MESENLRLINADFGVGAAVYGPSLAYHPFTIVPGQKQLESKKSLNLTELISHVVIEAVRELVGPLVAQTSAGYAQCLSSLAPLQCQLSPYAALTQLESVAKPLAV